MYREERNEDGGDLFILGMQIADPRDVEASVLLKVDAERGVPRLRAVLAPLESPRPRRVARREPPPIQPPIQPRESIRERARRLRAARADAFFAERDREEAERIRSAARPEDVFLRIGAFVVRVPRLIDGGLNVDACLAYDSTEEAPVLYAVPSNSYLNEKIREVLHGASVDQ